jgi:hypothetical protein
VFPRDLTSMSSTAQQPRKCSPDLLQCSSVWGSLREVGCLACRAIQAGKLPRKAGLTLVRHDRQYEVTLQAETLAVSGARLPAPEEAEERARLEERVTLLRHLIETLDLLYDSFGKVRFGENWPKELARMQKWLQREERNRVSAVG